MKVISVVDLDVSSEAGTRTQLEAGVPKILGTSLGKAALQLGAVDVTEMSDEVIQGFKDQAELLKNEGEASAPEPKKGYDPEQDPAVLEQRKEEAAAKAAAEEAAKAIKQPDIMPEDLTYIDVEQAPEEIQDVVTAIIAIYGVGNSEQFKENGEPKAAIIQQEVGRSVSPEERADALYFVTTNRKAD